MEERLIISSGVCEKCGGKLGKYSTKKICRKCRTGKEYPIKKKGVPHRICKTCGATLPARGWKDECVRCRKKRKKPTGHLVPCKECGKPVNKRNTTGLCQKCWFKTGRHKEAVNGLPG